MDIFEVEKRLIQKSKDNFGDSNVRLIVNDYSVTVEHLVSWLVLWKKWRTFDTLAEFVAWLEE